MPPNPTGVPDGGAAAHGPPGGRAAQQGEGARDGGGAGAQERYGPLSLLRLRKADGRALSIYSHARDERA